MNEKADTQAKADIQAAIVDSPEQAKVINAPDGDDLLVVAGAGSGKTYTMTRRIVSLIERGVPPERILGLTFTRKAAAELLSRVSAAVMQDSKSQNISGAKGHTASVGYTTHHGHNAQDNVFSVSGGVPRAIVRQSNQAFLKPQVFTYDAFFQTIVRQYGLLVGFDQNTQPLSEAGARQLASVVIDRHMDLLIGEDFTSFSAIVNEVLDLSRAIGSSMIGGQVVTVADAIARIREWDSDFLKRLDAAIGDAPIPEQEPKPRAPKRTKSDTDERYAAKRQTYRDELHQLCLYRCGGLQAVTRKRETLLTLVEAYEQEKRRQNMAEFSDFTVAAYQLVSRFPSIAQRYRQRYSHVLLDEYQDTSTTQAMLIATLFHPQQHGEEITAHDGDKVQLEAHQRVNDIAVARATLRRAQVKSESMGARSAVGAVGDPFQSIYAWRGASPGAFRMFQHDFGMPVGTQPYALSVTRRNSRIVLEAANNLTQPLRVQPRRASSSLMHEVDVAPLSTVEHAPEGTLGVLGLTTFGQEVDAVARFIKQAIALHANDGSGKSSENGQHPHVAVLFRSKTRMADFAEGLERNGLTTCVVGYSALLEKPEVRDVFALLHAACDRTNSTALMRLMATPRFALTSHQLADLASMAEILDTQYRYRALVEAGLVDAPISGQTVASGQTAIGQDVDEEATGGQSTIRQNAIDHSIVQQVDVRLNSIQQSGSHRGVSALNRDASVRDASAVSSANDSFVAPLTDAHVREIVKAYRDKIPHAVFLADLLVRDDLRDLLEHDGRFDQHAMHTIVLVGKAIRHVQSKANYSLAETVIAAVQALDLDIDTVVAQAMKNPARPVNPARAHSPMDSIIALVDTYTKEIIEGSNPTLRGFVSWVDSLKQVEEESAAMPETSADVVLMTVHQSKGLEWDAVAVVGMADRAFPSGQGGLRIATDEERLGGFTQGHWTPPEYHATVATWLDDPSAVPAPVRVDAGILPRFPHDADSSVDPAKTLFMLDDDVESIDDEIYADMRGKDIGEDMDAVDPDSWYLTQQEEYGRRLLADERRLAYVALTRARYDALLTYSCYTTTDRDPREVLAGTSRKSSPSIFWNEVNDSLLHHADKITAQGQPVAVNDVPADMVSSDTYPSDAHRSDSDAHRSDSDVDLLHSDTLLSDSDIDLAGVSPSDACSSGVSSRISHPLVSTSPASTSLDAIGADRPEGYFVGDYAEQYEYAVVEEAWRSPLDERQETVDLSWPATLSNEVLDKLFPVDLRGDVACDLRGDSACGSQGDSHDDMPQKSQSDLQSGSQDGLQSDLQGDKACSETRDKTDQGIQRDAPADSLLSHAVMLTADPDLMPRSIGNEKELDRMVRSQAERVLKHGRQNVTSLQVRTGQLTAREEREYWRGLIRPIPKTASPLAQDGTLFHAWAEQFINAWGGPVIGGDGRNMSGADCEGFDIAQTGVLGGAELSRESMIDDLVMRERALADHENATGQNHQVSVDVTAMTTVMTTERERQLATWQRRLVESPWARRRPAWAERQIVVSIPQLGNTIINGKLDAVFYGGLNPADRSKRYVIVDWKTGRRPHTARDIEKKLVQLDWYRLLLSAIERVPLDSIDATLYYLSEPDEGQRELHAYEKTEDEILAELSSGIPEQSDND